MGVVFRATHLHTQRAVAIKILRPDLSQEPSLGKRFVREARAATLLRHPNVVEVLDLGIEPDGTVYQVLELLQGEPLAGLLERKHVLPLPLALEVLLPVMDALAEAHAQGIVHRDLKPDNIFLARARDERVTPTLLDFGIAKLVDAQGSFATNTGSVMGTPEYMAPEQARGAREQGPAIDVWAMGVIAYECLTGRVPFEGRTPALVMVRIMTERAPRLDVDGAAIPNAIADVVARALAPDQGERYATMREMLAALREAAEQAGVPLPAPRETTAGPISASPPPSAAGAFADTEVPSGEATAVSDMSAELARYAAPLRQPAHAAHSDANTTPVVVPRVEVAGGAARGEPRVRSRSAAVVSVSIGLALVIVAVGAWFVGRSASPGATAPAAVATPSPTPPPAALRAPASTDAANRGSAVAAPPPEASPTAVVPAPPAEPMAASTPGGAAPDTEASAGARRRARPREAGVVEPPARPEPRPAAPAPEERSPRPERREGALPGVVEW